jgi:hypothetical protein
MRIRLFKPILPLSRQRERVGVRVGSKYFPLTFVLSPVGEEIGPCALLKLKVYTFKF